ncbi:MAG: GTP 3',8-cyclase MoaA [Deltaproteobacteria bacterium]|nr:GTP 3',8-cyclase MoaA [Deltaproteobacteria bacterium]
MASLPILMDPVGRRIRKLRISLVDACDFRCTYCMPDDPKFLKKRDLMSREEIIRLATLFVGEGIEEIRLTGGEPTLRADFMDIVKELSAIEGLKRLGVTSNGFKLRHHLEELRETRCDSLNISLDSLQDQRFFDITRKDVGQEIRQCIIDARKMGFEVKVNAVLQRGLNDDEIEDFAVFSAEHDVEVRFLEMMKIGVAIGQCEKLFISAEETLQRLSAWEQVKEVRPKDSTSFNYRLLPPDGSEAKNPARMGFIASETQAFCGNCSRLRLSPLGVLRPCLMVNEGHSLRNKSKEDVVAALHAVLPMKPTHRLMQVEQAMVQIGG